MKLICGPSGFHLDHQAGNALPAILFGQAGGPGRGSAGEAARAKILRRKLDPAPLGWDLLSIALSVIAADVAGHRSESPDGWTRDFELDGALARSENAA
jgi:hypothetical protein